MTCVDIIEWGKAIAAVIIMLSCAVVLALGVGILVQSAIEGM